MRQATNACGGSRRQPYRPSPRARQSSRLRSPHRPFASPRTHASSLHRGHIYHAPASHRQETAGARRYELTPTTVTGKVSRMPRVGTPAPNPATELQADLFAGTAPERVLDGIGRGVL